MGQMTSADAADGAQAKNAMMVEQAGSPFGVRRIVVSSRCGIIGRQRNEM